MSAGMTIRLQKNVLSCSTFRLTTKDSKIIRQYGSIFVTPAYLVQMEPVLCLDGKAETALTDCTATLGESQKFDICITSGKQTKTISNNVTAGSLYVVLLDSQTVSSGGLQTAYDQCVAQTDIARGILAGARERELDILELHRENIDKEIDRLKGSPVTVVRRHLCLHRSSVSD